MKLTAGFLSKLPTYINAVKEHELDLSGNHITLIENLGATRDLYDAFNFCNNSIRILGNFPELQRLQSIYIADNRIASIERDLVACLPSLHTLILTNNDLAELVDLEPLKPFTQLRHLSLASNPVMHKPHARLWCIWRMSDSLLVLDFERITMAERKDAKKLFEVQGGGLSDLAKSILAIESAAANTFVPGEGLAGTAAGSQQDAGMDVDKQESIAELKAKIREEMAQVEAMEEFI
ncbi:U2 snRNP complex subunit [Coemansia biformis]|uniref:U2 small nuclear ribonucleoprotein A' n=1 Tax=Coemansia biformis TaxID=1286918 RepID=A0A9W8D0P4_9FUNG|nr:U2 snRNP complex subunit [Coemansia biformis]